MPHEPRTTTVGSYPVPDWLTALPSEQGIVDATRVVLETQRQAGIDVIADGELYRFDVNHPETNGMIDYFVKPMAGIRGAIGHRDRAAFAERSGMGFRAVPAGVVEGPIGPGTLDLPRAYERARACTDASLKFTVTGPHMLSKTLLDRHYGDRAALATAIADVLAEQVAAIGPDVLQLDEANIPGHPEEAEIAAAAINRVLDAATGAGEKGIHVCFGNYGGQTIQSGTWDKVLGYMNEARADHFVLELAHRGYEEVDALRDGLDPAKKLGVGVIDIKSNVVESPDTVAERIETAAKRMGGAERIGWVHPDCGFWMLKRVVADRKIAALAAGRDKFLG